MTAQIRVLAVLVFWTSGALLAQQGKYLPGEIEGGGRLYSANCTGCHGPEGDGVGGGELQQRAVPPRVVGRGPRPDYRAAEFPVRRCRRATFPEARPRRSSPTCGRWLAPAGRRRPAMPRAAGWCSRAKGSACRVTPSAASDRDSRPSLTEIGSFRRVVELRTSLIEPDAEIRPENRSVRVVTRDGATITGRLLNQDTFTLQLLDAQERLLLLEKSNLREFGVLKTSPMPSYRDKLSEQELADLVGYLASLRGRP